MLHPLPKRNHKLDIERVAHNVIVHDRRRDYVHVLDGRAGSILEQCDGSHTCDQIAQNISRHSRVPYDRVAAEVAHLVAAFADLALIESA